MPTQLRTNLLAEHEALDRDSITSSPISVVSHDLAILDYENDAYNPYNSAPQLSDTQIESNFGRRKPALRK